ncbi:MAG: glycosyltransferase family 39 protein [Candidatus Melainabacteria bacterium]|nr:glycosyltransferase family 39 protein [Candidatus Melainabacteria bacterium]
MKPNHREPIVVGVLLLVLVIAEIAGQFHGNFPTNDDWIYGYMVRSLLAGEYVLTGWTLNTCPTHIFVGALPSLLFGFSFDVLRFVTLFWSLVTLVATWYLVKKIGASFWFRVFAVVFVGTNPLFYSLTHSFMTDITSLALSVVSTLAFVQYWGSGQMMIFVLCVLAAVLAGLSRQATLVTPLSFAVGYVLLNKRSVKTFLYAVLPFVIAAVIVGIYKMFTVQAFGHLWCETVEHTYLMTLVAQGPLMIAIVTLGSVVRLSLYLGGMLLPLLLIVTPCILGSVEKKTRVFLIMLLTELIVMIVGGLWWNGQTMPLSENLIINTGLGPMTLTDANLAAWTQAPPAVWKAITLLCGAGSAFFWTYFVLFFFRIIKAFRSGNMAQEDKFASVAFLLMVIYFVTLVVHSFYDRYLVFCLPFLAMVFIRMAFQYPLQTAIVPRLFQFLSGLSILFFAWYSFAGTHDYFTWNRARWQAIEAATARGVKAESLDGGMEFNFWQVYTSGKPIPPLSQNPYPYNNNEWLVSPEPLPTYDVVQTYPFERWLVPGKETIYLLKKKQASGATNQETSSPATTSQGTTSQGTTSQGTTSQGTTGQETTSSETTRPVK